VRFADGSDPACGSTARACGVGIGLPVVPVPDPVLVFDAVDAGVPVSVALPHAATAIGSVTATRVATTDDLFQRLPTLGLSPTVSVGASPGRARGAEYGPRRGWVPALGSSLMGAEPVRRIGLIGLGRMGLPICARFVEHGFEVVCTDLDGVRRELGARAGAAPAGDIEGAAAGADVVVTVLPGPAEVTAVAEAVTAAMASGAVWLELSTASPAAARVTAAAAQRHGVAVVDAPLGGGPATAAEGRLLSFAGARAEHLQRVRAVLEVIADRIVHVGQPGSGYAVKLLANGLWFGQAVATAEALTIATRAGLDAERVRAALGESAASSRFLTEDARSLLEGDEMPWFALARCTEQLGSLAAFADELAVPTDLLDAIRKVHAAALEHYGDVDGELLGAQFVAERSGVTFGAATPGTATDEVS
jgi:3-hydroxyisobutyrate dehydrogenase-like beta-hydroxyacid dehydrogenase